MFDRKGNVMQDILKVLNCLIKFSKKKFLSLKMRLNYVIDGRVIISPSGKTHRF